MPAKPINILIYSGTGSTVDAVRHCVFTFRRLLSPNYAVIPINGNAIIKEPWPSTCALLVMPGGADLGYCRVLNGQGNRRIRQYIERGGRYLGLCAGAYYGSGRCEFEVGNKQLEVIGKRELAFFPGTCRGLAFDGFAYNSEVGARPAELLVSSQSLAKASTPDSFRSYYNGGGVFVNADEFANDGVEIIAEYKETPKVEAGQPNAAVVYCKVGAGAAILCNTHPEFAPENLDHNPNIPGYDKLLAALEADEPKRVDFVKACLIKLELEVNDQGNEVPSLSRLHLSATNEDSMKEILDSLKNVVTEKDGQRYIQCENDTFRMQEQSTWTCDQLNEALPSSTNDIGEDPRQDSDVRFPDYDKIVKTLVLHQESLPASKETPYFNHQSYFSNLLHYYGKAPSSEDDFGRHLLYGEVVTSTNTMLEKNPKLLRHLPTGFTATATSQIAGRGRGSNVWVSPAGSLMFSTVIRHPTSLTQKAPVIFLQYLAALAIVQGVHAYDKGYRTLPIKLKWPNDIYALEPKSKSYVKIGGILVNSHYSSSEFLAVVGIGLNTTNVAPTTSLNALDPPAPFALEKLLASILAAFSKLYSKFCRTGFNREFEDLYYKHWLHTDQIVALETEGGARAKIKGITTDWGLLVAEELGWEDRPTGKRFQLQSDSNSFDFLKGLVKRKL